MFRRAIPTWAAQLFDSALAGTELFGAVARLAAK